jgi:hypothetical protein
MGQNYAREVIRLFGLGLIEIANKGYGLLLALLVPFKFGLIDYGQIQFLIFTLTCLAALVSGNSRTLLMRRSPKFRKPEYVMKYFLTILILSTIALILICLFLLIAKFFIIGANNNLLAIYENSELLQVILFFCWIESIVVMSISGGVFISLSLVPSFALISFMRIFGLIVSVGISENPFSLTLKLAVIDVVTSLFSIFYLFFRSGTKKLGINFLVFFRIFKMKSSVLINLGNVTTLMGLWLFQYVLSLGVNGLYILGLYGLINRYLSIVTTLPGLFFQKELVYFAGLMSQARNQRRLRIQILNLFLYSVSISLACTFFFPGKVLDASGLSGLHFFIILQNVSFCLLLNGLLGTRILQLGNYKALGRSDLGLGVALSCISIVLFFRPVGFTIAMTLFAASYLYSSLILFREIRNEC